MENKEKTDKTKGTESAENIKTAEPVKTAELVKITETPAVTAGGGDGSGGAKPEKSPEARRRKKRIRNLVFFAINIAVFIFVIFNPFTEQSGVTLGEVLGDADIRYLLISIGSIVIIYFIEGVMYSHLIRRTTGKRGKFILGVKTSVIGKYYDNITPLATGGQPFQVFYLKKHGLPGADAAGLPLAKYVVAQLVYVFFGMFVLIFKNDVLNGLPAATVTVMTIMAWIGIGFNLLIPLGVLLFGVVEPMGKWFTDKILRFARFFKIIKSYEASYDKVRKNINDFQTSMKQMARAPFTLIVLLILSIAAYVALVSAPYLVILTFKGGTFVAADWINVACMAIFCMLAISFFPLPGGSGAAELTFDAVFAGMLSGTVLTVALVTWRLVTYYFVILIGGGVIIYDYFKYGHKQTDAGPVTVEQKPARKRKNTHQENDAIDTETREKMKELEALFSKENPAAPDAAADATEPEPAARTTENEPEPAAPAGKADRTTENEPENT